MFFSHLSTILAKAFERSNVVKGWSDAGIYDPEIGGCNIERILGCWNPGGQNPNSSWRTMSADGRAYILAAMPILAEIGMQKGEISDDDVDNCSVSLDGKKTLKIKDVMRNEGASLVPDYMKLQDPEKVIDVGRGINLRRVILITNKCWLDAAKRSRALRGAGAVIFDPAKCLCGSRQQNATSHQNVKKHDLHVSRLVEALRVQATTAEAVLKFADGALVDLSDSALVLARARFASIAAGGDVVAPSVVGDKDAEAEVEPTAEEMVFMSAAAAEQWQEDIRLQELIALGAEAEFLLEEEESDASQHSNSKDDDAGSDTSEIEELSSGQETAELENDLASAMTGDGE